VSTGLRKEIISQSVPTPDMFKSGTLQKGKWSVQWEAIKAELESLVGITMSSAQDQEIETS